MNRDEVAGSAIVVLLYHRVCERRLDPFGLEVEPATFAAQVRAVTRRWSVVSLYEAAKLVRSEAGGRYIAFTFDDGYRCVAEHALPVLEASGAASTLFPATAALGATGFWWDKLQGVLMEVPTLPPAIVLDLPSGRRRWTFGRWRQRLPPDWWPLTRWPLRAPLAPTLRHAALRDLHAALRPLSEASRRGLMEQLRDQIGVGPASPERHVLGEAALRRALTVPGTGLGSHTVTHSVLSSLPSDEVDSELHDSRRILENLSARTVDLFAYPYGSAEAIGQTPAAVAAAGYALGFSNEPGTWNSATHPMLVPRLSVRQGSDERLIRSIGRLFNA